MKPIASSFAAILLITSVNAFADRPAFLGFLFTYHPSPSSGTDRRGWLAVQGVVPGGPAERAGLRAGDLITGIAGRPVVFKTDLDVLQRLGAFRAGEKIKLTILRDRQPRAIELIGAAMSDRQYEQWKANLQFARQRASSETRRVVVPATHP